MNITIGTQNPRPRPRTLHGQAAAGRAGKAPADGKVASAIRTTARVAAEGTVFAFNEMVELGRNDPALAMRLGATSISEKLLEGVDAPVREGFSRAIVPTIRLTLLGLNTYRFTRAMQDPTSNLAERSLDGLRVATDLVGLAGGLLKIVTPQLASTGETMMGVAYAADTVSHAIRGMTHGVDRVNVWKRQLAESKARDANGGQGFLPAPIPSPILT